ncbi:Ger(x)C family spore germination protein [Paenibacillus ferrarius]|uniref:Ger(x)C family spore germination protein n=1 Tax=Paenibacillus ferrarius TaxID=1469647 RepID=UPI003D26F8DE
MAPLKRYARTTLLLLACSLLTGCWDRVETNDVAFVLTAAFDLEDDGKYRVAYMFPLPGSMGGASGGGGGTSGNKSYYIDSEVGKTLREANNKLQMRLSRHILLSHRRTIVIGEKLAKAGIHVLFDVLPRSPENRLIGFLVATKGKGYDLLNSQPKFERFPAEVLRELSKSRGALPTSLKDVGISLSFGADPIVTYFETADTQAAKEVSHEVQLKGYVQFKGDRMVGVYRDKEVKGLFWLRGQPKEQMYTFPVKEGDDANVSVTVLGGKTIITPVLHDDRIDFAVSINARGTVREDHTGEDLGDTRVIEQLQNKFAEQIQLAVQSTIRKMQKEGTDSTHLGLRVWRHNPYLWKTKYEKNWDTLFKEAQFHIAVTANIVDSGLISKNVVEGDEMTHE